MAELYGGIDLGGTKIYSVVATADGQVCGEDERPTMVELGVQQSVQRMIDSLSEAARQAGVAVNKLRRVGVAAPGPINLKEGVITAAPNLGWKNVPLREMLREKLGIEVLLENDANAAALGEFEYGAARQYETLVYVTISTGIGGGFVLDGKIFSGASGAAGEIGHMTVEPDGPRCFCGSRGCLEMMASGTAIGRTGTLAVEEGRSEGLAKLADTDGRVGPEEIARAAAEGDPTANEILDEAARYIGIGLGSLINLMNPQAIVVGGGVSKIGARVLDPVIAEARRRSFPQSFGDCTISFAELGERIGALGAVAVAVRAGS
ncbi:MAG TPA: ROK family protein [Dehalococcoidia bacterium]|nr:ROK family protein [Dehalococcoidia bacterium]